MALQAADRFWLDASRREDLAYLADMCGLTQGELERLDLFTVSLLVGYLQRIAQLEQQVRSLQSSAAPANPPARDGPAPWHEPHA